MLWAPDPIENWSSTPVPDNPPPLAPQPGPTAGTLVQHPRQGQWVESPRATAPLVVKVRSAR